MIQQALSVCTSYSLLAVKLDEIEHICQWKDYPHGFIGTRIGIGLAEYMNYDGDNNNRQLNVPVARDEKDRMYVEGPVIGDQIDLDVRFYAKVPRMVRTLFPNEAPVHKHLQSNNVYSCIRG